MMIASDMHSTQGDSRYDTVSINSWYEMAEKEHFVSLILLGSSQTRASISLTSATRKVTRPDSRAPRRQS